MSDDEIIEVMEYIKDRIPMKLDLRMNDLKYDKHNIYYKIYKYICELKKKAEDK